MPERGAAVIGGEARREDQTDPAAGPRELQRALEKQLITVDVAGALQPVDARRRERSAAAIPASAVRDRARRGRRCRRAARPTADSRRSHRSHRADRAVPAHQRRLRETRAPSGRSAAADAVAAASSSTPRRCLASSATRVVEDRRERVRDTRPPSGVRGQNQPAHQKSAAVFHRASGVPAAVKVASVCSLSRTIAGVEDGSKARRNRSGRMPVAIAATRPSSKSGSGAVTWPGARRSRARPLATEIANAGANEAVANREVMIEKRQRPIGGQRRQPQRQTCELHGHRIEIDAVQAPFGDGPPQFPAARSGDRHPTTPPTRTRRRGPRHRRGSGTPRRETRRCPSQDRGRAAAESRHATDSRRAGAASGAPGIRSSRAAYRSCPSLLRSVDVRASSNDPGHGEGS